MEFCSYSLYWFGLVRSLVFVISVSLLSCLQSVVKLNTEGSLTISLLFSGWTTRGPFNSRRFGFNHLVGCDLTFISGILLLRVH